MPLREHKKDFKFNYKNTLDYEKRRLYTGLGAYNKF